MPVTKDDNKADDDGLSGGAFDIDQACVTSRTAEALATGGEPPVSPDQAQRADRTSPRVLAQTVQTQSARTNLFARQTTVSSARSTPSSSFQSFAPVQRPRSIVSEFIGIKLNDFDNLALFVRDHPAILLESTDTFQSLAVKAYKAGQHDLGDRIAQCTSLLHLCQREKLSVSKASIYINRLGDLQPQKFRHYEENFKKLSQALKQIAATDLGGQPRVRCLPSSEPNAHQEHAEVDPSNPLKRRSDKQTTGSSLNPNFRPGGANPAWVLDRSDISARGHEATVIKLPVRTQELPFKNDTNSQKLKTNDRRSSPTQQATSRTSFESLKVGQLSRTEVKPPKDEHTNYSVETSSRSGLKQQLIQKLSFETKTNAISLPPEAYTMSVHTSATASALRQFYSLCREATQFLRDILNTTTNIDGDLSSELGSGDGVAHIETQFSNLMSGRKIIKPHRSKSWGVFAGNHMLNHSGHSLGRSANSNLDGAHNSHRARSRSNTIFEGQHTNNIPNCGASLNESGKSKAALIQRPKDNQMKKRKFESNKPPSSSSSSQDQDNVQVASEKRNKQGEILTEFPCWWFVRDPVRFSTCELYCSRDRELHSYRRHHFDDHWKWGDVQADNISFNTWTAAKHAKCKQTNITPQERAKLKWILSYKILFSLDETDRMPDPVCPTQHHAHVRPKRPIRASLRGERGTAEVVAQSMDRGESEILNPTAAQDFVQANANLLDLQIPEVPTFFPHLSALELADPGLLCLQNAWSDRLLIANDLLPMNRIGNNLTNLIQSHICRIESLLRDMRTRPELISHEAAHQICRFTVDLEQSYTKAILESNQAFNFTFQAQPVLNQCIPPAMQNNTIAATNLSAVAIGEPFSRSLRNATSGFPGDNDQSSSKSQSDGRTSDSEQSQVPPTPTSVDQNRAAFAGGTGKATDLDPDNLPLLHSNDQAFEIPNLLQAERWTDF